MPKQRQRTEAAQVASIIRKHIKAHGIKARVKSKNFSMGNSITIDVEDLLPSTLSALKEYVNGFKAGYFDGMQDYVHL